MATGSSGISHGRNLREDVQISGTCFTAWRHLLLVYRPSSSLFLFGGLFSSGAIFFESSIVGRASDVGLLRAVLPTYNAFAVTFVVTAVLLSITLCCIRGPCIPMHYA